MTDGLPDTRGPAPEQGSAATGPSHGLHKRAVRASAWLLGAYPVEVALQTVRSLILTRLLFPEAFGLMAIVGVVMNGLSMLSDVGINTSIVQNKDGNRPEFLNTAWTMQIVRGVGLWLLCCAIAWPVSRFYGEPDLLGLIPAVGFGGVIMAARSTSISLLRRRLEMGRLLAFGIGNMVFELISIAAFAWLLRSVWGIVLGSLVATLVYSVASHVVIRGQRHRFAWHRDHAAALIRFGRWVLVSSSLTFFARQGDKLLLGKLVDMDVLGVYSIGLVLAMMPRAIVTKLAGEVLFPAVSEKARTDRASLDRNVARARALVLRVAALAVASVAIGAPVFFQTLYDSRYWDAGDIAQMLVVPAWFAILQSTTAPLLLAVGDVRALALVNLATFLVTWVCALVGDYFLGLPGFILGLGAGQLVGEAVTLAVLRRHQIFGAIQDLRFTLAAGALAGSAVCASVGVRAYAPQVPRWIVDVAIALVWIGPLAVWMARTSWGEIFGAGKGARSVYP